MKKNMTVREMARLGGLARAKAITAARASEIGRLAVAAREKKRAAKLLENKDLEQSSK